MHRSTSALSLSCQVATVSVAQLKSPGNGGGLLVRPTASHCEERACHALVRRMYAWRGYRSEPASPHLANDQLTLAAWRDGALAATLTLSRDNGSNLMAEALYPVEVAELRSKERIICEYSRLAIDPATSSTQLMEHFFRTAYELAKAHFLAKEAIVEINPRHRRFYEREIGFSQLGPLRVCPRVDAPALLLSRNMEQPHKARLRASRPHLLQLSSSSVNRQTITP